MVMVKAVGEAGARGSDQMKFARKQRRRQEVKAMRRAGRVVARISVGHRKLKSKRGNARKEEGKSSGMGLQREMKAGCEWTWSNSQWVDGEFRRENRDEQETTRQTLESRRWGKFRIDSELSRDGRGREISGCGEDERQKF